ncbi:MAG TPA: hypothetical protein PKH93_06840 [Chitinophagales bacterium]|nr:hypothetical protein [Chitinophagales bacterium]HNL07274.1 hypothetical protein [Chitinophagales bacterium]
MIQSLLGEFRFKLQRYVDSAGVTSDFFSEKGFFQANLRSSLLNEYLERGILVYSYRELSKHIGKVFGIQLSPSGIDNCILQAGEETSKSLQSSIALSQQNSMPPIVKAAEMDLYAETAQEAHLFYDGIGVKRQAAVRSDNPDKAAYQKYKSNKNKPKKVNSDIAVLQVGDEIQYALGGLDSQGEQLYSTMECVQYLLKKTYENNPKPLRLVAITDGASNIRTNLTEYIDTDICIILDWYHLEKKVYSLNSMFSVGNSKDKKKHAQSILAWLWEGNVPQALSYMGKLGIKNQEKYQELTDYLQRHQHEIVNYKKRKEVGGVIGSGRGEKANDTIIAKRQKNAALAWSDVGSNALGIMAMKHLNKTNK